MIHTFRSSTIIPCPVSGVFAFFSEAENLQSITPPELRFRILTPAPIEMGRGTRIDYRLQLCGIPFRWSTLITLWEFPYRFVDVQIKGPYRHWVHIHGFSEQKKGTKMTDEVVYQIPLWPLGEISYRLVQHELSKIFLFRERRIREIFGGKNLLINPKR
jgi:ligand-binding SRPBCC domain-containing protein